MNGLPSIIIGLFVFGLLVDHHKQSGFAGSVALAIIMLPLVARGSQEVLLLVPDNLREAADALGVSRWRTVLTVILPSALGGIVTATVLAVARAAGETAPLILVSSVFDGNEVLVQPVRSGAEHPGADLPALRRSQPRRLRPSLGAVAGAGLVHPLRQPRRPGAARPQPQEDELDERSPNRSSSPTPASRRRAVRRGCRSASESV